MHRNPRVRHANANQPPRFSCLVAIALVPVMGTPAASQSKEFLREVELTRKAGLPTKPSDLHRKLPPPGTNAADTWRKLTNLLKHNPLSKKDEELLSPRKAGTSRTTSELAAIRDALKRRSDVVRLVHKAVSQRACAWNRDWAKGASLIFPEFAPMRVAARILSVESELLLAGGKPLDAVQIAGQCLLIGQHAGNEGSIIGELVAIATDAFALNSLGKILLTNGNMQGVAREVRRAIENTCKSHSWREAIGCEVVMYLAVFDLARKLGPERMSEWLGESTEVNASKASSSPPMSKRTWNAMLDLSGTVVLKTQREMVSCLESPYPTARARAEQVDQRVEAERNPLSIFTHILLPSYAVLANRSAAHTAQVAVLTTAATLLEHRSAANSFTFNLKDMIAKRSTDPFDLKPIRYRKEGKGFVIWSVGETGKFTPGPPGTPIPRGETAFRYP